MASRRPNPAAERTAANQQVINSLLKLPGNKYCADCKRNKLPRWASWNLGIFICIRCSGIHRGMGTHISRVKSVDLDSWTDEQLGSMVKWGNTRANKYWEANLATGHIPSEAKIENFVRTKYESKRWVMDGPMPDPATLSDGEDEEAAAKQQLENHQSTASALPPRAASAPPKKTEVNLFDDGPESDKPISQPGGLRSQVAGKGEPAPPKSSKPGDSLLGLDDFFGPAQQAVPRPDSVDSNTAPKSNRPDLKTSILSLYSSAPKQPVRQGHQSTPSFGSPASPPVQQSAFGDFNDAFSGLNFTSNPQPHAPQPQKPNAFANLTSAMTRSPPVAPQVTPAQSGGFFGTPAAKKPTNNTSTAASSGLNDLFALSSPPQQQSTLSSTAKPVLTPNFPAFDNAWSSPSPAAPVQTQANVWGASNNSIASNAFAGLGTSHLSSGKKDDDDFGAFTGFGAAGSSSGLGASAAKVDDDPFANVWK